MHEEQMTAKQTKGTEINQIDFESMKDSASLQSQGGRRRRIWIISGLLLVVILAGGGFWIFHSNATPSVTYQTENVS